MAKVIDNNLFKGSDAYKYNDNIVDYDEVFTIRSFWKYGLMACRNVRWKSSTTKYELDLLCIQEEILEAIEAGKYRALPFNNFLLNERGKTRQISAQQIVDRGVQKVINKMVLLPVYEPNFIDGNTASMEGKGKRYAINMLIQQLQNHYALYGVKGGILVGDYKDYFASLPHEEIKRRFDERIHNETANKLLRDAVNDFRKLPNAYKNDDGWGFRTIGLGSELSQTIALDYPNIIDHWMEDNFNLTGDGRYMDDFYASSGSMDELISLKDSLNELIPESGIKLSEKKTHIIPFKGHKFHFLKMDFSLTETGKVINTPSKKSKKRARKALRKLREELDEGKVTMENICQSYNGIRASLIEAKDSYRSVYGLDIYFINLFRDELRTFNRPFKCYIKCIEGKNGYEYITKSLPGDKKHSIKQKASIKKKKEKKAMEESKHEQLVEEVLNLWNSLSEEDKQLALDLRKQKLKKEADEKLIQDIEERDAQREEERKRRHAQSAYDRKVREEQERRHSLLAKEHEREVSAEWDWVDDYIAKNPS